MLRIKLLTCEYILKNYYKYATKGVPPSPLCPEMFGYWSHCLTTFHNWYIVIIITLFNADAFLVISIVYGYFPHCSSTLMKKSPKYRWLGPIPNFYMVSIFHNIPSNAFLGKKLSFPTKIIGIFLIKNFQIFNITKLKKKNKNYHEISTSFLNMVPCTTMSTFTPITMHNHKPQNNKSSYMV
jgi:hypothetical protein